MSRWRRCPPYQDRLQAAVLHQAFPVNGLSLLGNYLGVRSIAAEAAQAQGRGGKPKKFLAGTSSWRRCPCSSLLTACNTKQGRGNPPLAASQMPESPQTSPVMLMLGETVVLVIFVHPDGTIHLNVLQFCRK